MVLSGASLPDAIAAVHPQYDNLLNQPVQSDRLGPDLLVVLARHSVTFPTKEVRISCPLGPSRREPSTRDRVPIGGR